MLQKEVNKRNPPKERIIRTSKERRERNAEPMIGVLDNYYISNTFGYTLGLLDFTRE